MKRGLVEVASALAALSLAASCDSEPSVEPDSGAPVADAGSPDASASVDAGAEVTNVATVSVDTDEAIATISPRFLSVAIDVAQVVGGVFWSPDPNVEGGVGNTRVPPYDFADPKIRALAAGLAPAYIRIGGSEADRIFYDLSDEPEEAPEGFEEVLTKEQWDGVMDFAQALDYEVFFTLNAGPGVRDGAGGPWQTDNARVLLEYALDRDDPVAVWELGNEINAFPAIHGFDNIVRAPQYVEDVATARALFDELGVDAMLAGPSSAFWPRGGEINPIYESFMELGGGRDLDLVTWHYYPQQSTRCPASSRRAGETTMLSNRNLDEVSTWAEQVESARDAHAPGTPVWLGETGHAQCGGQPGISSTYVSGFWWLDQLGQVAARGQGVAIRQTLSGSDYGILDDTTYEPRPDYWTSLLWRRLVGERVLGATVASDSTGLRAWAHCTRDVPGGVTLALVHIDQEQSVRVDLGDLADGAELYLLTAEELTSESVSLNGTPLALEADGSLPDTPGVPVDGALVMPPATYGFVTLPNAGASACE